MSRNRSSTRRPPFGSRCAMPGCARFTKGSNRALPFCGGCWAKYGAKPMPAWMRQLKRWKDNERYHRDRKASNGDSREVSLEFLYSLRVLDPETVEPYRGYGGQRKRRRIPIRITEGTGAHP